MSAAMLKQMMEDATACLKDGKFQQAADAARRVSQFSASHFQALMCLGVASYNLQQWEDAETALQRAADLKPELPAPWKNLVDLFDAAGDAAKKMGALEKLIAVFRAGNKVKPCQKWTAELATTAMALKLYGKARQAFDAWYSLVDESQGLSVDGEPNDELPSPLEIWLSLMDLLQLSNFSLSDAAASKVSMATLMDQFVAAARRCDWESAASEPLRGRTDAALAMFFRHQLNQVKAAKVGAAKQTELTKLDALTAGLVDWFPSSKSAAEYLLVRSEDLDSPVDEAKAASLASQLIESFAKSPVSLMFQGFTALQSNAQTARDLLVEGLASCSASPFHESALCVRAHVELAVVALNARDVEGCLSRLHKAQEIVAEKAATLGCAAPKPGVYSDVKLQLLRARAHDLAGAFDAALDAYKSVLAVAQSTGDAAATAAASVGAAELLCGKDRAAEALDVLEPATQTTTLSDELCASVQCTRAWASFLTGDADSAKALLLEHHAKLTSTADKARALKRLAIVYWHLGGALRRDKQTCFGSLLQAAKLAPSDGDVFAWIGKWYTEVARDVVRAEKCFLKALTLAPRNEMAGLALSDVYAQQDKGQLNVALWEELTAAPESAPTWALLRLAQHLVDLDDEAAVAKLHLVLRNDPLNAAYWVSMGHVYRHFGKLVAAQRSYLRAIELGETGWCVLTELARIEGSLHLFEDALVRIEAATQATGDRGEDEAPPRDVVATVHAELLFEQAKYLNGEGLYGRAAANIKKAAALLQTVVASASLASVPVLKLLGDVHSFAFYLSPLDFADEGGWIAFLARGREAYERVVAALPSSDADDQHALAPAHYDVGVSCWYQARALYSTRGKRYNAFAASRSHDEDDSEEPDSVAHLEAARQHLRLSLQLDPSSALAWNALGVVLRHPLAKQLAWVRAIQASNSDAAWANLGMLFVHQRGPHAARTAELARSAFLHLQAVNANNPAMWIGYGMIYLAQSTRHERRKAREAFQCALEMGNHLDALQGFALSSVLLAGEDNCDETNGDADDGRPSDELLLFATKKFLEREPRDAAAWSVLSIVQFRLGLVDEAATSSATSVECARGETASVSLQRNHALVGAVQRLAAQHDSAAEYETVLQNLPSSSTVNALIIQAQHAFHAGDPFAALKTAREMMSVAVGCGGREQTTAASFVPALCALTMGSHPDHAKELGASALAVVAERLESGSASAQELASVEAFHRAAGSLDAFASTCHDAALRGLALVDLADPAAFENARGNAVASVSDAMHLSALKSLLASDPSLGAGEAIAPMKLVRAEPWNPAAYALAALRIYKTAMFSEAPGRLDALSGALRLLGNGLHVVEKQSSPPASASVLLHWSFAVVHQAIGDKDEAVKTHADKALQLLRGSASFSAVDRLLWEARVLALVDPTAATAKYAEALQKIATAATYTAAPSQVLSILYELGGACESFGHLDAAHHVWKTVMSYKAAETASDFNVTSFLGNLHLAVVHASKQNAKSAKKFAKTAAALADAHDAASSVATTARFVESVVAKM